MDIKEIENKKLKYFKRVNQTFLLLLIYSGIALYTVSKLMSIMFILGAFIMWWALSIEAKRKKTEKPFVEDRLLHVIKVSGFKNYYFVFQLVVPALVMFVLFFSEIIDGPGTQAIVHSCVVIIGLLYCVNLLRKISSYETLIFDQGLYHQMIYYDFNKSTKHQFILLKKGGYIFEVNNGKNMASIKINKETYDQLNDIITKTILKKAIS